MDMARASCNQRAGVGRKNNAPLNGRGAGGCRDEDSRAHLPGRLPCGLADLAPSRRSGGCREINVPYTPSLLMNVEPRHRRDLMKLWFYSNAFFAA